jgi:hypothetical protein
VLEANQSVGGVWSAERVYPDLKSNNIARRYEYPDFPMDKSKYGVKDGEHIPAAIIQQYLTDVARKTGVMARTRFGWRVDHVKSLGADGWDLVVSHDELESTITTRRLIIATGLLNMPNMPTFDGEKDFCGPIFHSRDFKGQLHETKTARRAVVIGGAKSAYDVAWSYAQAGVPVDLLIRPDGNGPTWFAPAFVTPLKLSLECLTSTRAISWFSPCPFGSEDGWKRLRSILHGTWFGKLVTSAFWTVVESDVIRTVAWDKHPETAKLKPWNSMFWRGSNAGILNYDHDWLDLVRDGKVRVHVANVDYLSHNEVHLTDGTVLDDVDALVCATGFIRDSSIKFGDDVNLGLPKTSEELSTMKEQADAQLLGMYPRLLNQPQLGKAHKEVEPLRLYRFIVPSAFIESRNIAFVGHVNIYSTPVSAAIQALWVSAFFDGHLSRLLKADQVNEEVMLHTQWGKWRYPCGFGPSMPDMVFDCVPYQDMLLNDLGMKAQRKNGILKEMFESYWPTDYDGLLDEWRLELNARKGT